MVIEATGIETIQMDSKALLKSLWSLFYLFIYFLN